MAVGDCRVLHFPHGHNGRRRPAQRPGEGEGEAPGLSGRGEGSRPARGPYSGDHVFPEPGSRRLPGAPGRAWGLGAAPLRSRGGWAAASRLLPRPGPGTRGATAQLLGNRSPSGAPPRPFWEKGSRPRRPAPITNQRAQSARKRDGEGSHWAQRLPHTGEAVLSPVSPASRGGPHSPFVGQVVFRCEGSWRPSSAPLTRAGLPG